MKLFTTSAATLMGVTMLATGGSAIASTTNTNQPKVNFSHSLVAEAPAQEVQQKPPAVAVPAPNVVTVQSGDYLEKLATDNNATSLRIFYANTDIVNPDLIFPDQKLRIPTADESLAAREVPVNQQIATPSTSESTHAAAPQQPAPAARASYSPAPATSVADGSVWDRLAACEAGGNWSINTGNGFYGGLQFTLSSWQAAGGSGYPNEASRDEQITRGQILQSRQGWGAWPACTAKLGIG